MRYRVRLSVLEPPGVNGTPTPSIPGLVLSGRTEELVPVRVTTGPGDRDGEASYEIVHAGTGRFVEGGVGDSAWVRRFAGSSKLRRMQFVAESSLTLPQVRAALNLGRAQIEIGGRTWLGVSAADNPASSLGWWLFGFALAGAAYYANQRRGSLGDVDPPFGWTTGAHIPRFKSRAAAQAWADKAKRRSGRRWRVFSVLVAGETRYVPYTERT